MDWHCGNVKGSKRWPCTMPEPAWACNNMQSDNEAACRQNAATAPGSRFALNDVSADGCDVNSTSACHNESLAAPARTSRPETEAAGTSPMNWRTCQFTAASLSSKPTSSTHGDSGSEP